MENYLLVLKICHHILTAILQLNVWNMILEK